MTILSYWEERVRADVTPFVDPGTLLNVARSGSVIDASWTQRRKTITAQFVVRDADGIFVRFRGRELGYRAFFASEDMADIAGIAKTSVDVLGSGIYVDTRAESEDGSQGPAVGLIAGLVDREPDSDDFTSFVMVTGEAGAGKTSVLKQLVRQQARAYMNGTSTFVYLYVNAQGRALARFNEALATELNELRVALPHHAVAPLVKLGLIVPVIDGFDELLGVGGYDDAFSSISSFVQDLDGKGAIVASARSTYYEQEFLSRTARNAGSALGAWKVSSVSVLGWGEEERNSYLAQKSGEEGASLSDKSRALAKIFSGPNEPLSSKPLFVARATDFVLRGLLSSDEGALLERLVDAFVFREQREKLLKKSGDPILSAGAIKALCSDLAEEMWNLGTRELDRSTVRDIAEIAMSEHSLLPADAGIVMDRLPNMAFLQPGESPGSVAFEHEIFFDYFLASRIAASILSESASLGLLLGRSAMPESLAESVSHEVLSGVREVSWICQALSVAAGRSVPRQQLVKENAGRLLGALLRGAGGDFHGIRIQHVIFPGAKLHGLNLSESDFNDCVFRRCDLTAAMLDSCTMEQVSFELCLVNRETRLGVSGLDPSDFVGLRVVEDEGIRTIYEPHAALGLLRALGLPSAQASDVQEVRAVSGQVVELVDRLARAYAKCNPICVQDDYLAGIFDQDLWPKVQKIGEETGVLRAEIRAANGPRREFVRRLVRPEDLAAGAFVNASVPSQVTDFWAELERSFPQQ